MYVLLITECIAKHRIKALAVAVAYLILVFFFGLRFEIGNDWVGYFNVLDTVSQLDFHDVFFNPSVYGIDVIEVGYRFTNYAIMQIFDNTFVAFYTLQFLIFLFYLSSIYLFLIKRSRLRDFIPFLTLYFVISFYRDFDLLRQTIASGFLILAITFCYNNLARYSLCIFVASLFHLSAAFFLFLYPLFNYFPTKKGIRYIFFASISFALLGILGFNFGFILSGLIDMSGIAKVLNYIQRAPSAPKFGTFTLLSFFALFLIYIKPSYYSNLNRSCSFVLCLAYLANLLFVLMPTQELYERFSYYTYIGVAFVITHFFQMSSLAYRYLFFVALFSFGFFRFAKVNSNPETEIVLVPYKNLIFTDLQDDSARENLKIKFMDEQ